MASRIRGRKIVDTLGKKRPTHTSREEEQLRKDVPKRGSPGQKRRTIAGSRKEEHKHVMPWAIAE